MLANWQEIEWKDTILMYVSLANATQFITNLLEFEQQAARDLAYECFKCLKADNRRIDSSLEQQIQKKTNFELTGDDKNSITAKITNKITNPNAIQALDWLVKHSLYQQLETYLKNGQWREADEETARLILQIVGKEADQVLYEDEINTLPCDELLTIDQLWKEYSNGHFGFSIQLQIMSKYGELPERYDWDNYVIFAEELGWHQKDGTTRGHWLNYDEISFNLDSPIGHLPLAKSVFLEGFAAGRCHLFSRIKNCNL